MGDLLGELPLAAVLAVLFSGALLRSHALYWAGRAVTGGAAHELTAEARGAGHGPRWWRAALGRAGAAARRPRVRRAVGWVRRWGVAAVPLAYLTVGVQSAVFVAAGLVRMPYARFAVASVPGSLAWAVLWSTIGLGAAWAAVALAARSPWAAAAVALLAGAGTVLVVRRRTRTAAGRPTSPATR